MRKVPIRISPLIFLALSFFLTGCAVPGDYTQMNRLHVTGKLVNSTGEPLPDQPVVVLRAYGMRPQKKEMDTIRNWPVKRDETIRHETIHTDQEGQFEHTFNAFARKESFWVFPPFSLAGMLQEPDPPVVLLLKTPGPLGHVYQIEGKRPAADVEIYDPNIGRFRAPHRELNEEQISATIARSEQPHEKNPAYTQRTDHVYIEIRQFPNGTNNLAQTASADLLSPAQ